MTTETVICRGDLLKIPNISLTLKFNLSREDYDKYIDKVLAIRVEHSDKEILDRIIKED